METIIGLVEPSSLGPKISKQTILKFFVFILIHIRNRNYKLDKCSHLMLLGYSNFLQSLTYFNKKDNWALKQVEKKMSVKNLRKISCILISMQNEKVKTFFPTLIVTLVLPEIHSSFLYNWFPAWVGSFCFFPSNVPFLSLEHASKSSIPQFILYLSFSM